ncbi:hypothetical protein MYX76_14560, partial [Desulfobacterota bacterium AH_259_B03_O07]|nr:hypothetical protein [Desulfobacterota bacterium AH_259_B03_O07]
MKYKSNRYLLNPLGCFLGILFVLSMVTSCNNDDGSSDGSGSSSNPEILAFAEPDECFCGIGAEDNGPITDSAAGDCSDLTPEPPFSRCIPKTTYSYVWSLTKIGRYLWFGSVANAACLIGGGSSTFTFTGELPEPTLDGDPPSEFEPGDRLRHVCEYGESRVASTKPSIVFGDHRTPRIYYYDTSNDVLTVRSVDNCEG